MNLVLDVLIIIFLFIVFGYTHSLLASEKVKIQFKKIFGELIAFYRITLQYLLIIFPLSHLHIITKATHHHL